MSSSPPNPPQAPGQDDDDRRRLLLPEVPTQALGTGRPDGGLIASLFPSEPVTGYEEIDARIEAARQQLTSFTTAASALEKDLAQAAPGATARIGAILDQARAWVTYLSPGGPLVRGISPQLPPAVSIRYLTQIAEYERLAQQWVDYLQAARQQQPAPQQDAVAPDEQSCMRQIDEGSQQVNAQTMAFTLNSANMNSYQMQGSINDLNALLATLQSLRAAANHLLFAGYPACSHKLDGVIGDLQAKIAIFQGSLHSKRIFEASQGWAPGPIQPYGYP
jgi:hypothetical protein